MGVQRDLLPRSILSGPVVRLSVLVVDRHSLPPVGPSVGSLPSTTSVSIILFVLQFPGIKNQIIVLTTIDLFFFLKW